MSPISFSEKLKSSHYEYLLQTSTNGFSNKIVSTIFKDGNILLFRDKTHQPDLSVEELRKITEQFHIKQRQEFEFLFDFALAVSEKTNYKLVELIGKAFIRKNLVDEAIHIFNSFLAHTRKESSIFYYLGDACLRKGDYQAAGEALQNAVMLEPDFADFHNKLGLTYLHQGACSKALQEFELAIKNNVYYAEAYYYLGLTYIKNAIVRDDYALSVEMNKKVNHHLDYAIQLNPAYKREEFVEGMNAFHAEKYPEALTLLFKVLEEVVRPDPRILVENFYLKLIAPNSSIEVPLIWDYIKELNGLIKNFPGYADLYNDLGIAYCILGTYFQKESVHYFEKALQRNEKYFKAKKNQKLVLNENRGLEYLVGSLLNLELDESATEKRGLKIEFF